MLLLVSSSENETCSRGREKQVGRNSLARLKYYCPVHTDLFFTFLTNQLSGPLTMLGVVDTYSIIPVTTSIHFLFNVNIAGGKSEMIGIVKLK